MAIRIVPYTEDFEPAVAALNERFRERGKPTALSDHAIPVTLRPGLHPELFHEPFLAIDETGAARGGYSLKHQPVWLAGERRRIANYVHPVSEGIIEPRFGMLGLSLIVDAQKRQPLLYGLGLGGLDQPTARVMKGVKWKLELLPFHFRIRRSARVLRGLAFLRRDPRRRFAADLAAWSGLGSVGLGLERVWRRRSQPSLRGVSVEPVSSFGAWADVVWNDAHREYHFAAVREAGVLNLLYPTEQQRYQRLRVRRGDEELGWALVLATNFSEDRYFGNLRVGTIADGFARPDAAPLVLAAADRWLEEAGVDLMISNQSHHRWVDGLLQLGYRRGPSNFAFAASPALAASLGVLTDVLPESLLNRGDGDGPIHL